MTRIGIMNEIGTTEIYIKRLSSWMEYSWQDEQEHLVTEALATGEELLKLFDNDDGILNGVIVDGDWIYRSAGTYTPNFIEGAWYIVRLYDYQDQFEIVRVHTE